MSIPNSISCVIEETYYPSVNFEDIPVNSFFELNKLPYYKASNNSYNHNTIRINDGYRFTLLWNSQVIPLQIVEPIKLRRVVCQEKSK